jgi:GNAT superfamily N-acetyltransferase
MNVRTEVETIENLAEHATIPVAFVVERVLEVHEVDGGLGGFGLKDVPASPPWTKDYDAIRGEGPTRWFQRFDTSDWGLVAAYDGATRIGGAVIAPAVAPDEAVLWDLRVRPEQRSSGVGSALFRAVEQWSLARGRTKLLVETQNINVPACRFYARQGCQLVSVDTRAYPELPDETKLQWLKILTPDVSSRGDTNAATST